MGYSNKSMLELLEVSRRGFEHTLEKPELVEKVKEYGFNIDRIKADLELNQRADELYRAKKTTSGQKISKNLNVSGKIKEILNYFNTYRRILRKAYEKESETTNELLLNVPLPATQSGKFKLMAAFFEICRKKEHLLAKVSQYGLSSEKIAAAMEKINKIEKEMIDKSSLIMADEKATQDRNKAFKDLNHEWQVYKNILIAVFGPDNQELEEFGIIVPEEGLYKRRRKEKATPTDNMDNQEATDNKNNLTNPATMI